MVDFMKEFDKEFKYQQASIRMSNPKFFGVTKAQAAEYKKILAERESELYNPEIDVDDKEDDIIDVDYYEVPSSSKYELCKSRTF
jgi:hypothetical protein